jgi:hypothetical protein
MLQTEMSQSQSEKVAAKEAELAELYDQLDQVEAQAQEEVNALVDELERATKNEVDLQDELEMANNELDQALDKIEELTETQKMERQQTKQEQARLVSEFTERVDEHESMLAAYDQELATSQLYSREHVEALWLLRHELVDAQATLAAREQEMASSMEAQAQMQGDMSRTKKIN